MEGELALQSRQSESYNYLLAQKVMEKEREEEIRRLEADDGQMQEEMPNGTSDADFGMNHVPDVSGSAKRKRKPVKERLGERKDMDFEGNFELKEDDSTGKVVSEIAHRLREPKKNLIERVVKCIGVRKSLELLSETVEIEKNGGIMILNGTRRRTPGGVYLNLLKNTPSITQEQIKEIFYEENQRDYNDRKLAVRRRRNVLAQKMKHAIRGLELHDAEDEASRETFASDTAEAQLEELEDPNGRDVHAPPTPQPPPSPAAPDAVDCLELETTNDLDFF
uniref:phosphorylated adapter RNA export protein n=1 Tax=Myxine glutinosa TaxID=7769 RepID=UPI00358FCCD6